jgi:NAD(P)H-hydrate repair Nnr-like enzyme with NAD(P)H-hydrate epimerase domain
MTSDQKSRINYNNLTYLGYDLNEIYTKASKEFSRIILEKYSSCKNIVMICGTEGNGLDGLYVASDMASSNPDINIHIYIPGRVNQSDLELFKTKYKDIAAIKNIKLSQDIYAKDIPNGDLIIEALCGTGLEGDGLYKRSADILKRIVHFSKPIVAIDKAVPGYKPDLTISLNYPKAKNSVVISDIYPESLNSVIGPGELLEIKKPYLKSHKNRSGNLLLITNTSDTQRLKKISDISKSYPADIVVLSIDSLFSQYESNLYKDMVEKADVIVVDRFEEGDELISLIINKIIEDAKEKIIVNLSNTLQLNHIHLEMVLNPRELSNSSSSIRIVKGFNSSIIFNDGVRKIDTTGMLLSQDTIEDMMILSAVYATANELNLSVIAAAFTVIHFKQNKLDLEKDLSEFFEKIF